MATVVRKRHSYTARYKLTVVEFVEKTNNCAAQRKFGVSEKLVRDWRNNKAELESLPKSRSTHRVGVRPRWPELEEKIHKWVLEKRTNGIGLSGTMIRLKAKSMARENPDLAIGFTGCTSWLYRFMDRKNLTIRCRTKIAQRLPDDYEEKIVQFQKMIINMRKQGVDEMSQIGNIDETPMNFDMPPLRTNKNNWQ